MDELFVGQQRITGVGNLLPTGSPIIVYYVNVHSVVSGASLTLHNALVSSTTATVNLVLPSDDQGTMDYEWSYGVRFNKGVWIDTGSAGAIYGVIGYRTTTDNG